MTVTELREALQKLEAQGHGAVRCVVMVDYKDRSWIEDASPSLEIVGKFIGDAESPEGSVVVML